MKVIAKNKRGRFDYDIDDTLVAGLQLKGSEVKSAKLGHVSLKGSYVRTIDGELYLTGAHISRYQPAGQDQHEETRDRKLLVHKSEQEKIKAAQSNGQQIVPLSIGIIRRFIKLEIGLGTARKKHDKRQVLKRRDDQRDIARKLKR